MKNMRLYIRGLVVMTLRTQKTIIDGNGKVNKISSDDLPNTGYAMILYYLDKDTDGGMKSDKIKLYFILN